MPLWATRPSLRPPSGPVPISSVTSSAPAPTPTFFGSGSVVFVSICVVLSVGAATASLGLDSCAFGGGGLKISENTEQRAHLQIGRG